MALVFDIEKDKNIAMVVETSGIDDPSKLEFVFSIRVNDIKYGFPCKLKEGKIEICIPALKKVIKEIKVGKYKASLDIMGDKNYFLQPFNEDVELKQEPKVDIIVDNEKETGLSEEIKASISKIIESELSDNVNKDENDDKFGEKSVEKKKSSKMDRIFK